MPGVQRLGTGIEAGDLVRTRADREQDVRALALRLIRHNLDVGDGPATVPADLLPDLVSYLACLAASFATHYATALGSTPEVYLDQLNLWAMEKALSA